MHTWLIFFTILLKSQKGGELTSSLLHMPNSLLQWAFLLQPGSILMNIQVHQAFLFTHPQEHYEKGRLLSGEFINNWPFSDFSDLIKQIYYAVLKKKGNALSFFSHSFNCKYVNVHELEIYLSSITIAKRPQNLISVGHTLLINSSLLFTLWTQDSTRKSCLILTQMIPQQGCELVKDKNDLAPKIKCEGKAPCICISLNYSVKLSVRWLPHLTLDRNGNSIHLPGQNLSQRSYTVLKLELYLKIIKLQIIIRQLVLA